MRFAVHALSLVVLLLLVFGGGFLGKMLSPELTWCAAWPARRPPSRPRACCPNPCRWDVLHCFNLRHLLAGSVFTGLGSLLGFVISSLGWGMPRLFTDVVVRGIGGGGGAATDNDTVGKLLLFILVLVGLCIALSWIFGVVERCVGLGPPASRRTSTAAAEPPTQVRRSHGAARATYGARGPPLASGG